MSVKDEREILPRNARPMHYTLTLVPDLQNFKFSGSEAIQVEILEPTASLTLNSNEIEVDQAHTNLTLSDGSVVNATSIEYQQDVYRVVIGFGQEVHAQTATLNLKFTGELNDKMAGFYRSAYQVGEETRYMAVTQFEAVDARRAFPCWDEPAYKATFDISLTVPKHLTALSNSAISEQKVEGDLVTVTYHRTPKMSTYLVAFVVGELDYVEAATATGMPVRVWTPLGRKEEGRFALSVATKTIDFFTEYFDIPYPLPKLDMVATNDFAFGAMENWGLVTYRSVLLLFNPETTSAEMKQRIAYVVAHELAHQWFGNLVTMSWWTDLWLNEGFATWVGWRAVDHIFPEWKVWDQFVTGEFGRAMELDALRSSHPIQVTVNKADEIGAIFDAVSYSKGASVLRMLVAFVGEKDFQTGLRAYLKKHQYSNTQTTDLWDALSAASGKDVEELMNSWTKQTGYPVVKFEQSGDRVVASQSRFLQNGHDSTDETLWAVPLMVVAEGANSPSTDVLRTASSSVPVSLPSESPLSWFKANGGQTSFYRAQYSEDLRVRVAASIAHVGASDRCGIIADSFALAAAGNIRTSVPLALLSHYISEQEYVVWKEMVANLSALRSVWHGEAEIVTSGLQEISRTLIAPAAHRLGWDVKEGESHLDAMNRSLLLEQAAALGDPTVLAEARSRFAKFVAGNASVLHPDLRHGVFSAVLAHGSVTEFDQLLAIYRKATSQDFKVTVLSSLGEGSSAELVTRALDFALSDEVRAQDMHYVFSSAANSKYGRDVTWEYVKINWQRLYGRLQGTFLLLGRTMNLVCKVFTSEERRSDVRAFFQDKPKVMASIERNIDQAVEAIQTRANWLSRDRENVAQYCASLGN